MRFFLCFVFLIFFFLTPKFLFSETIFGEVSFVPDGDTIHLKKNFKKFKIRLYGIDCPEIKQLGGVSAKRRVKELIFKKKVKVESKGYDRYGRVIGKVFIEGKIDLGLVLVTEGFCWWYTKYAKNNLSLSKAELNARKKKIGVWGHNDPLPPWEWRKLRRKK
ncbi:MAG: thermonuclease family protein [bacterium]